MNVHPIGESGEMMLEAADLRAAALRQMSAEELRYLGTREVVYLKAGMRDGALAFVVFAADGIPLVIVDAVATALEMASEHGLGFVAVH